MQITVEKDINGDYKPSTMGITNLKEAITQVKQCIKFSNDEIKWFNNKTTLAVKNKADNRLFYWQDVLKKLEELSN